MKRITALLLALIIMLPVSSFAQGDITVYINGSKQYYDVNPQIINDRTMLPMRAILEALGADVYWNDTDKSVLAKKDNTEILLTIGEDKGKVNEKEVSLDAPAQILNGRTLVPVRFISEALGAEVLWNESERKVDINIEDVSTTPQAVSYSVKAVTAIGDDGNKPENTIDGKYGTRWSHESGSSWIIFELYEVLPVDYIGLVWYYGDERMADFEVHTSKDGVNYTKVFEGKSSVTTDMAGYDCENTDAKFVKLVCKGNTANLWNSICEAKIYPPHESGEIIVDVPASLSRSAGSEELMAVLAKFDSHFGQEFIDWLASLYDVESGGFYATGSGRDYPGYYPDIESTLGAMDIMKGAKLWDAEAELEGMIPDEFLKKMSDFARERQNPDDGFFYDPHVPNPNDSKKSRNAYQAPALIAVWPGATPKYKTANERLAETMQGSNEGSTAETQLDPRFVSEESINAWLEENWKTAGSEYVAANNIAAAWSLIEAAGLEEPVRAFLRAKQNPETGLFGKEVNMAALNGAMKAGCAFNTVEAPYPNYQKVIKSVTEIVKKERAYTAAETWNPLSLIDRVVSSNAENMTPADLAELDANLTGLFEATYEKFKNFFQPDGGGSWYKEGPSPTSQDQNNDVSVCFKEGNMDGAFLLLRTRNYAYSLAGIARPQIVSKEQKIGFWNKIKNAQPVVKKSGDELWTSIYDDFEDYETEDVSDNWRVIQRGETYVKTTQKNMGVRDNDNHCLEIHGGGRNTYVDRHCFTPDNFKTVVAKFDISINSGAYFYNYIGSGKTVKHTAASWLIDARHGGDWANIYITRTGSDGKKAFSLNLNEWYEMEFRYTPSAENNMIEIFVDGKRVYGGNDYYYGSGTDNGPAKKVDGVGFVTFNDCKDSIFIDNLEYYYE